MSVAVDETIYKTEVVKVSEMPEAEILNPEALFLVAQYDRSKKVQYKTVEKQISRSLSASISSDLETIRDDINSLSSEIDSLSSHTAKQISKTQSELEQLVNNRCVGLSISLSESLTNDYDQKISKARDETYRLKQYVTEQNIPKAKEDIKSLQLDNTRLNDSLCSLTQQIAVLSDKEESDCQQLSGTFSAKIEHDVRISAEKTAEDAHNELTSTTSELKSLVSHDIENLKYALSEQINCNAAIETQHFGTLSTNDKLLKTDIEALRDTTHNVDSMLCSEISTYHKSLVIELSTLSANEEITHALADKANATVTDLDIKLYGLEVEQLNSDNELELVTLSVGDINIISASIDQGQQKQSELQLQIEHVKSQLSSLIISDVRSIGPIQIDSKSEQLVSLNIKTEGYMPFAITEVQIRDENNLLVEGFTVNSRYIQSSEEGKVQIYSHLQDPKSIFIYATVMYVKSM